VGRAGKARELTNEMTRFTTQISSSLTQEEAFAYMAAFENAADWDPSVTEAQRLSAGEPAVGTQFHVVSRFAGKNVALRYEIVRLEPPRIVVLGARNPSFRATDTITVEPVGSGSVVEYDAVLDFSGVRRLLEPMMQAAFQRIGRAAEAGMRRELNR
jgi:hypothetical protein